MTPCPPENSALMTRAVISELHVYPVKSFKGIRLERATLTPRGFSNDRRWMIVRSDSRFVTQRDLPRLALVETRLETDGVTLSLPGRGSVTVPFDSAGGDPVRTKIWGVECEAVDEGEEIARWLTAALDSKETLRMVHMRPGFIRPQGKPHELGPDTHTLFADAAPFLVAGEASLDELNRELIARRQAPVPMNRFRPNIVVRGLEPFEEHRLAGLAGGAYGLEFCHPCERCVVTTIDQATGQKDLSRQPFITLRDINPMPGGRPAPAFGQNAILAKGDGASVALGDQLTAM